MKKVLTLLIVFVTILISANASAQERIKIKDGLYLVSYGNTCVIEDEINQRSISMEVSQEIINDRTNEKIYTVVCGKWTKRTVKDGLKAAIDAGIYAAASTKGMSLIISEVARLADYIYDDVCDYYGEKYNNN